MAKITADTLISECLELNPDAAEILLSTGMHCIGCPASQAESLEEAAFVHGIDADALVAAVNEYFSAKEA